MALDVSLCAGARVFCNPVVAQRIRLAEPRSHVTCDLLLLALCFGIQWLLIAVELRCPVKVRFDLLLRCQSNSENLRTRDVKRKISQENDISQKGDGKITDKTRMP